MAAVARELDELARLTPPPKLAAGHGGDAFHDIGRRWSETLRIIGGLRPEDRVLDVGCGPGRMAIALAPYLGSAGRYEGFDVRTKDIAWCKREIEPRWPGSRFDHVDVRNDLYNPAGTLEPASFRFPYRARSFDFVFLTSVLTHLRPPEARHYLSEVCRVLAPRGRCLITYFLLNDRVRSAIRGGSARFEFAHPLTPYCWSESETQPEEAIAYDEGFVRGAYADAGLAVVEPIHFGAWSTAFDERTPRHSQDIVVAVRAAPWRRLRHRLRRRREHALE